MRHIARPEAANQRRYRTPPPKIAKGFPVQGQRLTYMAKMSTVSNGAHQVAQIVKSTKSKLATLYE